MVKFCKDCFYARSRQHKSGVEVMCTNEQAPISWRNQWVLRSTAACVTNPLKCPIPEEWFKQKEQNAQNP